jgi:large subunit ribosomal protein L29
MKASVIREMTTKEVSERIAEEKVGYDKLRMSHHISPLENPVELKSKRKLIARLSTELRARAEISAS